MKAFSQARHRRNLIYSLRTRLVNMQGTVTSVSAAWQGYGIPGEVCHPKDKPGIRVKYAHELCGAEEV